MIIKDSIQHYINVYHGSENRVIDNTIRDCRCKRKDVEINIDWLIAKGYVKAVEFINMTDLEKAYYNSDHCTILRNLKKFDEIVYYEEENKRKAIEDKLSNKEKFILFFDRMEKEFERKNFSCKKEYYLDIKDNVVVINSIDDNNEIVIDFNNTSNWYYSEIENSIYYKKNSKCFTIELFYLSGCCYIKHY